MTPDKWWTIAGALAGAIAAVLAGWTLLYTWLRDRSAEMPAFRVRAMKHGVGPQIWRLGIDVLRLSQPPAWNLTHIRLVDPGRFGILALRPEDSFPEGDVWKSFVLIDRSIEVGCPTPIVPVPFVLRRAEHRRCKLVFELRRGTGEKRRLRLYAVLVG